jgi:hypothetical protein
MTTQHELVGAGWLIAMDWHSESHDCGTIPLNNQGALMKPQLSKTGTILNAAVLSAADLVHKRVLCPACMEKEFARWPEGWDAHAAHRCKGLDGGSTESRKAEFKQKLGHLFR